MADEIPLIQIKRWPDPLGDPYTPGLDTDMMARERRNSVW
jgi:hypothetical protein